MGNVVAFFTYTHSFSFSFHTHTHDSEWLVLYCGASSSLGHTLEQYCRERGIKYKTEFFGW